MLDSQSQKFLQGLDEHLLSKPEEEEDPDKITHTEEGDTGGARDENDHQGYPEQVHEEPGLQVLQVGAGTASSIIDLTQLWVN